MWSASWEGRAGACALSEGDSVPQGRCPPLVSPRWLHHNGSFLAVMTRDICNLFLAAESPVTGPKRTQGAQGNKIPSLQGSKGFLGPSCGPPHLSSPVRGREIFPPPLGGVTIPRQLLLA